MLSLRLPFARHQDEFSRLFAATRDQIRDQGTSWSLGFGEVEL